MFGDRGIAYVSCNRDFAAANILWGYGSVKAATFLFQQTLEQTTKYEFTELTTEITSALSKLCRTTDQTLFHRYTSQFKEYEIKRRWEFISSDRYDDLTDYYIVKRSPNMEVHQLACKYFDELLPMCSKIDTFTYYFFFY